MREATARLDGSDHQLAWTLPSEATVLGDFDDAQLREPGGDEPVQPPRRRLRDRDRGCRRAAAELRRGRRRRDPAAAAVPAVAGAGADAGVRHRLGHRARSAGTTSIPDQVLQPHDGLHWTGPYKSWEARCAECHATGFSRNYDPASRSYAPRQAEIGVGCEACHGPGEAHAAWARDPGGLRRRALAGADGARADRRSGGLGRGRDRAMRRLPLAARGLRRRQSAAGDAVSRQLQPRAAAPRRSTTPTGRSRRRTTSSARSCRRGCMRAGVRCSDCHDPHALSCGPRAMRSAPSAIRRRATTGSRACRKALYDDPAHIFHPAGRRAPPARAATCRPRSTWGWTGGATTASGCRGPI